MTISLGLDNDGSSIDLKVKNRVAVRLPESTSGYIWQIVDPISIDDHIKLVLSSFASKSGQIGFGQRTFEFEGTSVGQHTLKFELRRPWEVLAGNHKVSGTFTIHVNVIARPFRSPKAKKETLPLETALDTWISSDHDETDAPHGMF